MSEPITVRVERKKVHHSLHFIATCATWGLWLPLWIIAAVSA